jgi:hypothetical protein
MHTNVYGSGYLIINDPLARILPQYDKDTVTKERGSKIRKMTRMKGAG